MKILILLLLTFNIYASERMIITDLRNNSIQGNEIVESHVDAMARIVEMGKMGKKNWREGEFNLIQENSLYSKAFLEETENSSIEVIKYYHPTNWSYSLAPLTQAEIDEKETKEIKKARKDFLKTELKTKDLSLKEINELLR